MADESTIRDVVGLVAERLADRLASDPTEDAVSAALSVPESYDARHWIPSYPDDLSAAIVAAIEPHMVENQ